MKYHINCGTKSNRHGREMIMKNNEEKDAVGNSDIDDVHDGTECYSDESVDLHRLPLADNRTQLWRSVKREVIKCQPIFLH